MAEGLDHAGADAVHPGSRARHPPRQLLVIATTPPLVTECATRVLVSSPLIPAVEPTRITEAPGTLQMRPGVLDREEHHVEFVPEHEVHSCAVVCSTGENRVAPALA